MSEDIVKRLRSQERIVFPVGTQIAIAGGTIETMQPISMQWTGGDRLEAAAEIEYLRARVAVLSDALSGTNTWLNVAIQCPAFKWDADQKQAAQRDCDDARAALEAQP